MKTFLFSALVLSAVIVAATPSAGQYAKPPATPQQAALATYFEQQVAALDGQLEREIKTKEDWLAKKDEYRRQLAEMLGLDPMPPRTDLKPVVTGTFEHEGILVENLHFQAMPGLYVTGNLYRPKVVEKPLPAVLYVCGHAIVEKNGISYGNKAQYEHHGVWYGKHGFVCLVVDTVELGEIRGEHHGSYNKNRFWWWSRGYEPAGCEAWMGIRALDYLETRPEVDKTRFGVTGRSGGGINSWWIAALDDRIKAAAPTAGITTLKNHVVDGCVEGHCDCMYLVNTYRWDYDKVAALVAPRALCIVNTDKDGIYPIDGVFKVYQNTRRIYKLLDMEKNIGLQIGEGPHADTQTVNVGEFHWMMRFLQGADRMSTIDSPAVHSVPMEKLRVFPVGGAAASNTGVSPVGVTGVSPVSPPLVSGETPKTPTAGTAVLPSDERNTTIDESFVPLFVARHSDVGSVVGAGETQTPADVGGRSTRHRNVELPMPQNGGEWVKQREGWLRDLTSKVFAGWTDLPALKIDSRSKGKESGDGVEISTYGNSEQTLWVCRREGLKDLELVVLNVLDEQGWQEFANTYAHKFSHLFPEGTKAKPDDKAFEQEKKMFQNFKWGMAYVCPRGIGPGTWVADAEAAKKIETDKYGRPLGEEKARIQRLRRFYLLGQTLEGQQVWDVRCAIRALRSIEGLKGTKLWLQASRTQAANAMMASLFEDNLTRLDLHELPHSLMPSNKDKEGHPISGAEPVYLNMLKYLDLPQAAAMAAERTRVVIYDDNKAAWNYPARVSEKLGWGQDKKNGLQLRDVPKD